MADLGNIAVKISADPTTFEAGCAAAQRAANKLGTTINSAIGGAVQSTASKLATFLTSPIGAAVALGGALLGVWHAIGRLENAGIAAGASQARMARQFGITADAAAALQQRAALYNLSNDDLNGSLRLFAVRLGQAAQNGGETEAALNRLGLTSQQLARIPLNEALGQVGDALMRVDSATDRLGLTQAILSRRGMALLPMFRGGSEAMRQAEQQARALGISWGENAERAEQVVRAQRRAEQAIRNFRQAVSNDLGAATLQTKGFFAELAEYWGTWATTRWRRGLLVDTEGTGTVAEEVTARMAANIQGAQRSAAQEQQELRNKEVADLMGKIGQEAKLNEGPIQRFGRAIQDLEATGATVEQMRNLNAELDAMRARMTANMATDLTRQMEDMQAAAVGRSHRAVAFGRALQAGEISPDRQNEIDRLVRQADGLESVNRLLNAIPVSPLERLQNELRGLEQAWQAGVFGEQGARDLETFDRAMQQAFDEFDRAESRGNRSQLAAGLTAGSAQAISLINQATTETSGADLGNRVDRVRQVLDRQLDIGSIQRDLLRQIADQTQPRQVAQLN